MTTQPQRDIPLSGYTTFRIGGRARYFIEGKSEPDIIDAIRWADAAKTAVHILGGGSNLVISDAGISGLVLRIVHGNVTAEEHGDCVAVRASAGVPWDEVVRLAAERNLSGIECLSGIPGCVGATPIQNVGAYGQEVSQSLVRVRAYDRVEQRQVTLSRDDCELEYRDSRFKSREPNRFVILNVEFELQRQPPKRPDHGELVTTLEGLGRDNLTVAQIRSTVLDLRRKKSMLVDASQDTLRSAGCFFVNPIVPAEVGRALTTREGPSMPVFPQPDGRTKLSAGWLIERAGFSRGHSEGPVGLSPYHCLVLVAHERARAEQVVGLAHRIRDRVLDRFGIRLIPEPNFWGFDQFDAGLPLLNDLAPPTLGSIPQPVPGH